MKTRSPADWRSRRETPDPADSGNPVMLPRSHPEYLMTTASMPPDRLARRRAARKAAANARLNDPDYNPKFKAGALRPNDQADTRHE